MKAHLAFYRGKGTFIDSFIRWWTNSNYSHVELVINHEWYSSSIRDKGVRKKRMYPKLQNWDLLEVDIDIVHVLNIYNKYENSKYDFTGVLLTHLIPLNIESKNKKFCSELCAEFMKLDAPYTYTPESLCQKLRLD
jgi:hypothetical protein